MAYTEFYVSKGVGASDTNAGGPRDDGTGGYIVSTTMPIADNGGGTYNVNSGTGLLQVGDWCFNATAAEWFYITVIVDATNFTVVAHDGGLLTTGNQPVTVGGHWATIQHAVNTLTTDFTNAASDPIWLNIEEGTYDEGQIDVNMNTFTAAIPLHVEGYQTTARDGCNGGANRPTITSTSAVTWLLQTSETLAYLTFAQIDFDGNSQATYCVGSTSFSTSMLYSFSDCRFTGATSDGIRNRSYELSCYRCEIDNNGGMGYYGWIGGGNCVIQDCDIHDNTTNGIDIEAAPTSVLIERNKIYDNGGKGIWWEGDATNRSAGKIIGNTIYGNTGDGATLNNLTPGCSVSNNSVSGNGAYGFNFAGELGAAFIDYNHTHDNTSGVTNLAAMPGSNNQTGDPLFTSVVDGSEDFTPTTGSPLIDTGSADNLDIGAVQAASGGGGGLLTHPGMNGGVRG